MRLIIAEKPSLGKDIAQALGGVTAKGSGYVECGTDVVTWCFGHMFEEAEPDVYLPDDVPKLANGKKQWRVEDLPIIPAEWQLNIRGGDEGDDGVERQVKTIGKLLADADVVIHAGDPDREGQLIIDRILAHHGWKKPVLRLWPNSQDDAGLKKALANLTDNQKYAGYGAAAMARGKADWLIGMNLSRAFTLRAQRGGSRALLTVGRVQTPTLALVVQRDRDIEAFKPVPFHNIVAAFSHSTAPFIAQWVAREDQEGLDAEGRLVRTDIADALVAKIKGGKGTLSEFAQEKGKRNQPLGYSLAALTKAASAKYQLTAARVLEICQALYETHKLTSYPRTDCRYLAEAQHAEAPAVLAALKHSAPEYGDLINQADPRIKSPIWNDKKLTAHNAIIPTLHKGDASKLSVDEKKVYDLIVRRYLAQLFPVQEVLKTTLAVTIASERFEASGIVVTKNGWREVTPADDDDSGDGQQVLPVMKQGDEVLCAEAQRKDTKTRAPNRFTEGTLLDAMESIHRYVPNPDHRKLLRESDGLGTSPTRPVIIEDLKRRQFLAVKGQHLESTPLGRSLVDALPEVVKSPVLTALYEGQLSDIQAGNGDAEQFLAQQVTMVCDQVRLANDGSVTVAGARPAPQISQVYKCPECGKGLARHIGAKSKKPFWSCSGYPGCKTSFPDVKGRPYFAKDKEVAK